MLVQVHHVGVLGVLFPVISVVDQKIETVCAFVSLNHSVKLLLLQKQDILNRFTERIQQVARLFTKNGPGLPVCYDCVFVTSLRVQRSSLRPKSGNLLAKQEVRKLTVQRAWA